MKEQPQLFRGLGIIGASSIVAGTVIGTGIFLVPSSTARAVDSVGLVFLAWLVGGLLSLAGALCYAELGAALPEAGGEYVFLRRAYGPLWGFVYGWEQFVVGKAGSIATIAIAFAVFLGYFYGDLNATMLHAPLGFTAWSLSGTQVIAIAAIAILTLVNYFGIVLGGAVQTVFTVLKVAIIMTLTGLAFLSGQGETAHFSPFLTIPKGVGTLSAFGAALAGVLWAYDGWNNLTMVGAEVKNPGRNIPHALIFGTGGVMLVYLFVNAAYFYILPLEAVKSSEHVAQDMAHSYLGGWGAIAITAGALISTFATLNASILSGARVAYAMARDRLFFRHVAEVHPVHRSPAKALLLQGGMACFLVALFGSFEQSFTYTIFGLWLFYALTAISVFVLRHKEPNLPRPYRTLGYPWIPAIFVALAAAFCINIAINNPKETGLGLLLIAAGLPCYWMWSRKANKLSQNL